MGLDHVQIVLSHPSEPRNVGAVCRAIKNAGISRLTIVTGSPVDYETARPVAVDARDILDSAHVSADLATAIADSTLIAGVTRRVGQRRKPVSFTPWQLAGKVAAVSPEAMGAGAERRAPAVSIVFGNEQSGLSDAELELCHMAVSIPSAPELPSLNLSHAVQIITYELLIADLASGSKKTPGGDGARAGDGTLEAGRESARIGHVPVTASFLADNVERIIQSLESLGFHTQSGPQGMKAFLKDILGRAMLSEGEASRIRAVFEKLEGMHPQ